MKRVYVVLAVFSLFLALSFVIDIRDNRTYTLPLGNRILVVVPHPDDESLSAAGLIQTAIQQGKDVRILAMTNGDGFTQAAQKQFMTQSLQPSDFIKLGQIRQQEMLRAAGELGLSSEKVIFLGLPDGRLHQLWNQVGTSDQPIKGLTAQSHCPYALSYAPMVSYTGNEVVASLMNVIRDFQPTDIVYPHTADKHLDHSATHSFVAFSVSCAHAPAQKWDYLVHYPKWPHRSIWSPISLTPPKQLINDKEKWLAIPLSAPMQASKRLSVESHISQTRVMRPFLEHFIGQEEWFMKEADISALSLL